MSFSHDAYVRQLKLLLPPGSALDLEEDSELSKTLSAIADELARVDARGIDLINESDPRTANETIGDWETALGLPDDEITTIPGTLAERRIAVTQKYVTRGGQNVDFFVALAAACGYTLAGGTLPTPTVSSVTSSPSGGTLGADTYTYEVTAFNHAGETNAEPTIPSPTGGSVTIGSGTTNTAIVHWPRVPGADGYRVYRYDSGNDEFEFIGEVPDTGSGTYSFNDPGTLALTVDGKPPSANTATYPAIEKFAARMLRSGFRCGDRCYGVTWAYSMRLNIAAIAGTALSQADFERVIRHRTHAHIYAVIFVYH